MLPVLSLLANLMLLSSSAIASSIKVVMVSPVTGSNPSEIILADNDEVIIINAPPGSEPPINDPQIPDPQSGNPQLNDIGMARAIQIARDFSSVDLVKKVEFKERSGESIYKIEFIDGSKVEIDAATGIVLKTERRNRDVSIPPVRISILESADIARWVTGPGEIRKIELRDRKGNSEYKVEFFDGRKVEIDAQTGEVLSVK